MLKRIFKQKILNKITSNHIPLQQASEKTNDTSIPQAETKHDYLHQVHAHSQQGTSLTFWQGMVHEFWEKWKDLWKEKG